MSVNAVVEANSAAANEAAGSAWRGRQSRRAATLKAKAGAVRFAAAL